MAAYQGRGGGVMIFFVFLGMTTGEVKTEIIKVLEQVPENVLTNLLDYVKELQKHSSEDIELAKFMRETLIEDRQLLEKLAQ